ncbi:MAG: urease accessory protein UreH [Dehalococcoidia bacterium]
MASAAIGALPGVERGETMETGLLAALILGLLLGMRHALDPDHMVAVSTIVSEYRNPLRALWVGVSWGLGHTTTLALLGVGVILLNLSISERTALALESAVGVMLILLGLQVFWNFRRQRVHLHAHEPQPETHRHLHSHAASPEHAHHLRWSLGSTVGKPLFRVKSYIVGTVHGIAGSAALMLLVLASIKSPLGGLSYIVLFGVGSVVAMGVLTVFLSLPFSVSARFPAVNRMVQVVAGVASIAFGGFLLYEIAFVEGLLSGAA